MAPKKTKKTTDMLQMILASQTKMDKKLDLHIARTEAELVAIKLLDEAQNKDLAEHKDTCIQLKRENALKEQEIKLIVHQIKTEHEERLTKLEVPQKWVETTKNLLLGLATVAGAVVGIIELIKLVAR